MAPSRRGDSGGVASRSGPRDRPASRPTRPDSLSFPPVAVHGYAQALQERSRTWPRSSTFSRPAFRATQPSHPARCHALGTPAFTEGMTTYFASDAASLAVATHEAAAPAPERRCDIQYGPRSRGAGCKGRAPRPKGRRRYRAAGATGVAGRSCTSRVHRSVSSRAELRRLGCWRVLARERGRAHGCRTGRHVRHAQALGDSRVS